MQLFAGIIDPETLLAKSAALCTALEIRYDLFLERGASLEDLTALSKRVRNLYPKAFQIGTIRLKRDGGMFSDAHAQDRDRYLNAILSNVDRPNVVDIEVEELGANGYKTACMSTAAGDFDEIYPLIEQESKNFELFSLFAMGASGQESRVKSLLFGANITYCSIGKAVAPGQLSVEDALNQYKKLAKNR